MHTVLLCLFNTQPFILIFLFSSFINKKNHVFEVQQYYLWYNLHTTPTSYLFNPFPSNLLQSMNNYNCINNCSGYNYFYHYSFWIVSKMFTCILYKEILIDFTVSVFLCLISENEVSKIYCLFLCLFCLLKTIQYYIQYENVNF